jgi:hypothetical protein
MSEGFAQGANAASWTHACFQDLHVMAAPKKFVCSHNAS